MERSSRRGIFVRIGQLTMAVTMVGAVFLLSRCGNNTSSTTPGTFTDIYTNTIVAGQCANCHKPGGAGPADGVNNLDFTSQSSAYTGLTTQKVEASDQIPQCASVSLVDSGKNPQKSYFAAILIPADNTGSNFAGATGCTVYTDAGVHTNAISAAEIASINQWIQAGAPNN